MYDHFSFLSSLAASAATVEQSRIRSLSQRAWEAATVLDDASVSERAAEVEADWNILVGRLRQQLPHVRLALDGKALACVDAKMPGDDTTGIALTDGLATTVLVTVENRGESRLVGVPRAAGGPVVPGEPREVASGGDALFAVTVVMPVEGQPLTLSLADDLQANVPHRPQPSAKLRITVLDEESGEATPARVFVLGSDGMHRHGGPFAEAAVFAAKPEVRLPVPASYRLPFFYTDGVCDVTVPPGRVQVTAERGFEHGRPFQEIDLQPGCTSEVTLSVPRMFDAATEGWVSGDTHVHWVTEAWNVDLPLAWLATVQRAEDLRVANNLTLLHRTDHDAFVKPSQAPMGPVAAFSDSLYHIEMAEEYRNQNLYGHLCLLNLERLIMPIGTGPEIAGDDSLDYPINRTAILDARSQGGVSIEAHGTGNNHELPVNVIHGLTDSIDQLDPKDYERLLDCGFLLPLTNGSDHPARVVGAARAYVQLQGPFSYEAWIDGIRRAHTFTTSGPLLFLDVAGHGPGDVIVPRGREPLPVQLRAVSRFPLGLVEIVSKGKVIAAVQTQETEALLQAELPADESGWVLGRASHDGQWNPIWSPHTAITSGVAVHVGGRPFFDEQAAREWVSRMQAHLIDIDRRGRFAHQQQRDEAKAYVQEAIRRFERRIAVAANGWQIPDTLEAHRERLVALLSAVGAAGHDPQRVAAVRAANSLPAASLEVDDLTAFEVDINPEARVKLRGRTAPPRLVKDRTERFLLKVTNEAGLQAPLRLRVFDRAQPGELQAAWFSVRIVENGESTAVLSGAKTEWKLIELRHAGGGDRCRCRNGNTRPRLPGRG